MTEDHAETSPWLPSLFGDLGAEERALLVRSMRRRDLDRGEVLVTEGAPSDTLFVVLHGAFEVRRADKSAPVAEIHSGELIGEIGFLAGSMRTATVRALRDASVLELDRAAFSGLRDRAPAILDGILAALARRLADTSARLPHTRGRSKERTVAIVFGGAEQVPEAFLPGLRRMLDAAGATVVDRALMEARFGPGNEDGPAASEWLNRLEQDTRTIVYLADRDLSVWTRKTVRQADVVYIAVRGDRPPAHLSEVERLVAEVHEPESRRLVRIHDRRAETVSGTAAWLDRLDVFMPHHVSLQDDADLASLARFITGRAIGFVAGGGGGLGSGHVGVFRAFAEIGVEFDIFGGTSVGAAMLAGFCRLHDAERLDLGTHRIFVTSRSFKRPTWPRYSLLDHRNFDAALQFEYGSDTLIEDCWRPFFAVTTNLSTQTPELIRRGEMWRAVRASSAIPGLLPPVYTPEGMMLVDGGLMDNVPLGPMREVKTGPNLVVHFGKTGIQTFDVDYDSLPGRGRLVAMMLNPLARPPRAPSAMSVLWRSLLAHQRYDLDLAPNELELRPPHIPGSSVVEFSNHRKVYLAGYEWARTYLEERRSEGDPALAEILEAAALGGRGATLRDAPVPG